MRSKFDSTHTQIFEDAVAYLSAQPPKKQVILNGKLDWSEVKQGDGEGSSDYILRLVRTVRNNLFHGGKFPNPTGPMADTARDRALLENCLVILNECALMDWALKIWLEPTE